MCIRDRYNRIFTIEEHVLQGGFGSAVAELLLDNDSSVRLTRIGLPDKFIEHGSSEELLARYGLDIEGIKKRIKEVMQEG